MKRKILLFLSLAIIFTLVLCLNLKSAEVEAKEEKTVYEVLTDYYNNGSYKKETTIHLNDEGVTDLAVHFHVENHLKRTTYYEKDSLWMSRGEEIDGVLYSYYGTSYDGNVSNGVTYGTSDKPLIEPEKTSVVLNGEGKNSMEEYYTTLYDLIEYNAIWSYENGIYTSTNDKVLKYFLDFTAPCLYGSVINSNIFSYAKATIQIDTNSDLVLKLWVSSTDYGYIVDGENSVIDGAAVLSEAVISHEHKFNDKYSFDEESHWYECGCGMKEELEKHTFDNGNIYNDITIKYTCKTCGYEKLDVTEDDLRVGIDNKFGLAIRMPEDRDIKIAQFADLHFGVDGNNWHNFNLDRTKVYIKDVVKRNQPDLIVCSGDNIIGTGITNNASNAHDLVEFIEFMEQFKTPWTFMYGNHDAETKDKKAYSDYLVSCVKNGTTKYLMYQEEYIEVADKSISSSDQGRYGNYSIQVLDPTGEKLLGSIIMFDAGTYLYDLKEYQTITPGQIDWYENKINTLQAIYSKQEGNLHETIPTIVFSHIQLPQHKAGYSSAYLEDGKLNAEFVIRQDEYASELIGKSGTESGLFAKMVELGSTKAYFVGHAHTYKFQVKVDGIVLGYAPISGHSKLDGNGDLPREVYTYNVSNDFSFTTTITEEVPHEPNGLTYSYSSSEDEYDRRLFNYDKASNTYYGLVDFKEWGKIRLRYNGVCLTPDNTIITGDFNNNGKNVTNQLYQGADKTQFVFGTARKTQIAFTYNPTTNFLNIHTVRDVTYGGTHSGTATYDVINNRYTFETALPMWGRVEVKVDDVYITDDNIEGAFYKIGREHNSAQWDRRLYTDGNNYSMICCIGKQGDSSVTNTFQFSYNPATGKLEVAHSLVAGKVNGDMQNNVSIWEEGKYLAKDNDYSVSNTQWRLVLVVDKDGRIAFMTYYPSNGYGSPYNTNLHYTHSIYSGKPSNNPCLNLYQTNGSNRYDIFVPEGGFAITAHGTGVTNIVTLLGLDASIFGSNVLKPGALSDDIRLGYDSSSNTIFVIK